MVTLTFPDGARREYPDGISGAEIAKGISPSLAKRSVAMALDGTVADLADPIEHDTRIEFLTREDPRALPLIRHDAAHVLAEAVQTLWPGTQVTIGPVIENGFYYDFFRNQPFTPDDFAAIESKMREIIARDKPFTKETWSREKAKRVFRDKGELFKVELVDAIPQGEDIKIYKQGEWFDLCRGPHMTSTGKVGGAFKLLKVAGAYWRGVLPTAKCSHASTALLSPSRRNWRPISNRSRRQKNATTASWAGKWICSISRKRRQARFSGIPRDGRCFRFSRTTSDADRMKPATWKSIHRSSWISSLWVASGHMEKYRDMIFLTEHRDDDARTYAIKPMNCPGHIQIFKNGLKSYRDLPLKIAEFGKVHRFEPSGALHGLLRVRAFTQDDAHVFITEAQIAEESSADQRSHSLDL